MATILGALNYLSLKTVWPHEERDFTPWLSQEANLAELSKSLGLDELQFEAAEVPVGPYTADILARSASGEYVVIENQFGKTDHDHLGKLVTYGATLGASTLIWIAETFSDEHRKAVEWLNENTDDSMSFFAVKPEVIKIDDSKPAIRFNVVCQPNEVVRAAALAKSTNDMSAAQRTQLEFWTLFREKLLSSRIVTSAQAARPQYWFDVPLGRSYVNLSNIFNTWDGKIGVRVYISNRIAEKALEQLEREKKEIEHEIGQELQWNPNPANRDKIIGIFRDIDVDDREAWPEQIDWLADMTKKFRDAFGRRVKKLDLSQPQPPESSAKENGET